MFILNKSVVTSGFTLLIFILFFTVWKESSWRELAHRTHFHHHRCLTRHFCSTLSQPIHHIRDYPAPDLLC